MVYHCYDLNFLNDHNVDFLCSYSYNYEYDLRVSSLMKNLLKSFAMCFLITKFWNFFIYFGYKSFIGYMICRYFHTQSVACHFFLLKVYFEKQNFFIVVNPNYFFFFNR